MQAPEVGPCGGTLGWDPRVGPLGETLGWDSLSEALDWNINVCFFNIRNYSLFFIRITRSSNIRLKQAGVQKQSFVDV